MRCAHCTRCSPSCAGFVMRAFVVCGACAVVAAKKSCRSVLTDREAVLGFRVSPWRWRFIMRPPGGYSRVAVKSEPADAATDDPGTSLSRWVERTKSQIMQHH